MAAVRDLSTSDAVFKFVINNTLSTEWKSQHHLHNHGGLPSSQGLKERPSLTVEQNQSSSNSERY